MHDVRRQGLRWAGLATLPFLCSCGGKSVERATDAGKHAADAGKRAADAGRRAADAGKNGTGMGGSPYADAGNGANAHSGRESSSGGSSSGSGGTSSPGSTSSNPMCRWNDLPLVYPDMYSAYIEGSSHLFQLPALAIVSMGTTVQWTASDPSAVRIDESDTSGLVWLTTKKAGNVTITADVGGRCGTSTLHVAAATEEQWQAGNARYNNMNPLPKIETDAGIPVNFTNLVVDPPGRPPACTNCHGDTATNDVFRVITYTPVETARYSDVELIDIFTKGLLRGYYFNPAIPVFVWTFFHSWSDLTAEQAQDMVVYLRSLPVSSGSDAGDFMPGNGGAAGK